MSSAFLISLVIQVLLIIHCIRTGRNCIVDLGNSAAAPRRARRLRADRASAGAVFRGRGTRRAVRGVRKALDPEQDLRRYQDEARLIGDVASRQRYADELVRQGRSQEASESIGRRSAVCTNTIPNLLLGLARAQFASGAFSEARATLDALIAHNPDFRSPDGHLLYARALEGEGNRDKALEEYAAVSKYYAGAEAALRYAQLLRASGRQEQARRVLRELLEHARLAPRHYRKMQQEWLAEAERELAAL